jgi:hypothetical protein
VRRRRDIFCNGRPEDEKEGATTLFADLPGECLRPNISHGDIGGRKPTFEDLCALTERIGDFATTENLARRHARLWDVISFQLSFRVTPVPNSEGPGTPVQI